MARPCKFEDISGKTFGRLKVIKPVSEKITSETKFLCECSCGKKKEIVGRSLTKGLTLSCGCYRNERVGETNSTHGATKVGANPDLLEMYRIFSNMWSRCTNSSAKNYRDYGGRGINVCSRWESFEVFLSDMGERPTKEHSIDRVDNNKGYSPENCRWATWVQQANNKRNNLTVEYQGRTVTVKQLARRLGINYYSLRARITRFGWSVEDAATLGIDRGRRRTMLTAWGVTKPLQEWSKEYGKEFETVRRRIQKGSTPEKALTDPVLPCRARKVKEKQNDTTTN